MSHEVHPPSGTAPKARRTRAAQPPLGPREEGLGTGARSPSRSPSRARRQSLRRIPEAMDRRDPSGGRHRHHDGMWGRLSDPSRQALPGMDSRRPGRTRPGLCAAHPRRHRAASARPALPSFASRLVSPSEWASTADAATADVTTLAHSAHLRLLEGLRRSVRAASRGGEVLRMGIRTEARRACGGRRTRRCCWMRSGKVTATL
jgi:hypothetical protein